MLRLRPDGFEALRCGRERAAEGEPFQAERRASRPQSDRLGRGSRLARSSPGGRGSGSRIRSPHLPGPQPRTAWHSPKGGLATETFTGTSRWPSPASISVSQRIAVPGDQIGEPQRLQAVPAPRRHTSPRRVASVRRFAQLKSWYRASPMRSRLTTSVCAATPFTRRGDYSAADIRASPPRRKYLA